MHPTASNYGSTRNSCLFTHAVLGFISWLATNGECNTESPACSDVQLGEQSHTTHSGRCVSKINSVGGSMFAAKKAISYDSFAQYAPGMHLAHSCPCIKKAFFLSIMKIRVARLLCGDSSIQARMCHPVHCVPTSSNPAMLQSDFLLVQVCLGVWISSIGGQGCSRQRLRYVTLLQLAEEIAAEVSQKSQGIYVLCKEIQYFQPFRATRFDRQRTGVHLEASLFHPKVPQPPL